MAVCFIESELLPIKFLHSGNGDFRPFCSRDLDHDPMTFVDEPDRYSQEMYRMCENKLVRKGFQKL